MLNLRYILLLFFVFFGCHWLSGEKCWAQDSKTIDSLKHALKNAKHDTSRCIILLELANTAPDDEWPNFNEQLLQLAENNLKTVNKNTNEYSFYQKHLADAINNVAYLAMIQGDIDQALELHHKSLKLYEVIRQPDGKFGDKKGIALCFNNLGFIYNNQGNIPKALEYYRKSLNIREKMGDKNGIAQSLNNIAMIYKSQGESQKALEYHHKSLKIFEEIGNKPGIAQSLNNIGFFYNLQGKYHDCLEYYRKSLKLREETGDKQGLALTLSNIGAVYENQGDPDVTTSREDALRAGRIKAIEFYNKSIKIAEEIGDKKGMAQSLNSLGGIYFKQEKYSNAEQILKRGMSLSKDLGFPADIRTAAECLSRVYKAAGNHKLALENYELFIQMRDSLNNESTRKASIKSQLKYEYEKQAAADSVAHAKESEIKNAEIAKQTAEIKAKKNQQYALFGGLGLVMGFAVFMYNRFKVTQKQKGIIEHQKEVVEEQKKLVEEKQKEILDSIQYARRIQLAQIPTEKRVQSTLNRLKK